jgi:hypothetical protein
VRAEYRRYLSHSLVTGPNDQSSGTREEKP